MYMSYDNNSMVWWWWGGGHTDVTLFTYNSLVHSGMCLFFFFRRPKRQSQYSIWSRLEEMQSMQFTAANIYNLGAR